MGSCDACLRPNPSLHHKRVVTPDVPLPLCEHLGETKVANLHLWVEIVGGAALRRDMGEVWVVGCGVGRDLDGRDLSYDVGCDGG